MAAMSTNEAARRLGEAVLHRRTKELHLNQLEVAASGGPSNTLQTDIENGRLEILTPRTAKKIDTGLMWEAGSAMRIWEGRGESVVRGVTVDDEGTLYLTDNVREMTALREFVEAGGEDGSDAEPPTEALRLWSVEQLLEAASIKHRDEMDLLNHLIHVMRKPRTETTVSQSEPVSEESSTPELRAVAKAEEIEGSGED